MKAALSRPAAAASAAAAVIFRLFYGLMIESPGLHNGAWLAALLGLVLALPALWCVRRGLERSERRPLCCILALLLLLDAADVLECAAFSESYIAYDHVPTAVLALPLLLAAARSMALGGNAVGSAARVWMLAFVPLLLVIVVCQLKYYRPAWLFPVLGYGMAGILRAGVRAAGWITAFFGAAMLLCDEAPEWRGVCLRLGLSVLAVVLLIALRLMMAPSMDAGALSRQVRIDALLTNGRSPLYLQLPMVFAWFTGMLQLLCFDCAAARLLLRRLWPGLGRYWSIGLVLLSVTLAALLLPRGLPDLWRWPALVLAAMLPPASTANANQKGMTAK